MRKCQPKYWNRIGKYQKRYDELYAQFVPDVGECDNDLGEIIRIVSRIYYDIYNNGGWNLANMRDWRIKLVRLSPSNMKNAAKRFIHIPKKDELENDDYVEFLDKFVNWAVSYVDAQLALKSLEEDCNK